MQTSGAFFVGQCLTNIVENGAIMTGLFRKPDIDTDNLVVFWTFYTYNEINVWLT